MLKLANAYGMKFLVPPNDEGVGACLLEAGEFARVELEFILAAAPGERVHALAIKARAPGE